VEHVDDEFGYKKVNYIRPVKSKHKNAVSISYRVEILDKYIAIKHQQLLLAQLAQNQI
jgi:hypothetical protein